MAGHLTDDEICRKFSVEKGSADFEIARRLSDYRADSTVNDLPIVKCPHCGYSQFRFRNAADLSIGDKWHCLHCLRPMHVVFVQDVKSVTLSTEPG